MKLSQAFVVVLVLHVVAVAGIYGFNQLKEKPMYQSAKEVAIRGAQLVQSGTSVGKALGGKAVALFLTGSAALTAGSANAAITVPPELLEVFTDLATAFGTLVAAGAILFGVIRGTLALFKLARSVFGAAGA